MQGQPFNYGEVANLTNFGVENQHFKFGVLSFESDKYISVKEPSTDGSGNLIVIEPNNNFKFTKKPNKAEAAIMHPEQNIIALKGKVGDNKYILQVFSLEPQKKLKAVEVNEPIVFWKWLNPNKLGFVTGTSAYAINIYNENEDKIKLFDRAGTLTGPCQVIGFSIDPTEKWGLLSAISSPDGGKTINGHMQLCLIEGQKSQILDGHCGCFGEVFYHSGDYKSTIIAFFERKPNETTQRVHLTEIGAPKEGQPKLKKVCEIQMPPQFPNDFPVFMHVASRHGLLYLLTKFGHFFVVEISSAAVIGTGKLSNDAIFIGAKDSKTDGALVITRSGNLIRLTVDENNLVKYISTSCGHIPGNAQVGTKLALHYKLPGAENILMEQFNQAFISGDYVAAARIAGDSPGSSIRNAQTIQKFKSAPPQPGRPQPVLQYFSTLLEKGKLNALESVELVGPVLAQGRFNFIEGWLKDNKLECTEELGRLLETNNQPQLALTVYEKGGLQNLKAQVLMKLGRNDEAVQILKSGGGQVDWLSLIRSTVQTNPDSALNTAKEAAKNGANIYQIAEVFLSNNRIQELTGFLVENMKENRSEDAQWQTRVLELNLMAFPQVADAIFQMEIWKIYDRKRIGQLCEQKGLAQRALENYTDFQDIRRIILNYTVNLNQEWLTKYLGNLDAQMCLNLLKDLLKQNRQNTQLVVQVAIANNQKLGAQNIIQIFESMGSFDGIYYFLGSIINSSQDPDLYFKYIEAAAKCNQTRDVERIIRETKFYDPVKVKDFLMEIKMTDPKPLMFLCDMHNFVDDLTRYLVKNNFFKHIEVYVLRLSPQSAPIVLGTLIDLETDEKYILGLLSGIRSNCPIEQLVAEFEKRNKLRMLESWLEARVSEGNQVPGLHNALAKICIDTNKDPQNFLTNNPYYDSKVVGKYAEEIDPHLAIIAYKRAWGQCDQELVETTDKYKMFRIQAKYLVERRDKALWSIVLNPENPNRKDLIEQVVSSALPDSKNADEVIVSIEAFMAADLPNELISLLEKIVLHNSEFSGYRKLQNLLIITAIKSDKTRVMDYINRLDNYDGDEIAKIALGEDYQLYEEAFVIYKKMKKFPEAIDVLLNNIESIPRAAEFAEKVNEPTCWSRLGNAYLLTNQVTESIESFMKANDAQSYGGVIPAAIREEKFELLTKYLLMARQQVKDVAIDTELVYCLAKTQKLGELETFITEPNSADLPRIGDRIYEDGLYEAARLIFVRLKNNAKIASCLIKLKKFGQALEAAKKANTPKTWKELCIACVAAKEYKIANAAGMNIVIHPDHLDELILNYEKYGCADEMIALLEQAMGLERAHVGIYTELGILYAKYHPEKLMEHIKNNFQRLNVSKLLRTCERYQLWPETVYLYTNYNEFDNAILTMIEHSPSAWQHEQFANLIQKVSNTDLYYKSVLFYLEEQPMQLNDLLKSLATKMDLSKLISVMRKTGHLPLITPFMKNVQNQNNQAVNEALNELYLEGEDHENLWLSVTQYENIDQLSLAQQTERHHLIEFRRISAYLYRRNQKYSQSIALSKLDKQYRDAVETAQESGNSDIIEDLIKFFIENKEKEYFTVCLYTCYEFLRPDLVLELSWRYGLFQFSMPYFIQLVRDLTSRVDTVQKKHDEREKKEEKQAAQQMAAPGLDIMQDMGLLMPGLSGLPMLMGPDMGMGMGGMGAMGGMGGMGAGMGGMGAGMGGMGAGMGGMNPMGGAPMGGAPMGGAPMGGMGGFNTAPGFNPRGGF